MSVNIFPNILHAMSHWKKTRTKLSKRYKHKFVSHNAFFSVIVTFFFSVFTYVKEKRKVIFCTNLKALGLRPAW